MPGSQELYHLPGFYEPFSAISHLIAAPVFFILGIRLLLHARGDWRRQIFLGIFALAAVFCLAMSGVYHMMVRGGVAHGVLGRLDFACIYILIAATFTPGHGILFRGPLRSWPIFLIWSGAILGLTMKAILYQGVPDYLSLTFFLTLGWFGVLSAVLLYRRFGFLFILPLLLGGLAYSFGGVMDLLGRGWLIPGIIGPHEMMHIWVLVGLSCHYRFVWGIAARARPMPGARTSAPAVTAAQREPQLPQSN